MMGFVVSLNYICTSIACKQEKCPLRSQTANLLSEFLSVTGCCNDVSLLLTDKLLKIGILNLLCIKDHQILHAI